MKTGRRNLSLFENSNTLTDLRHLFWIKEAKVFPEQKREFYNNRIKVDKIIGPPGL